MCVGVNGLEKTHETKPQVRRQNKNNKPKRSSLERGILSKCDFLNGQEKFSIKRAKFVKRPPIAKEGIRGPSTQCFNNIQQDLG
jgi:hypothetical protein